MSATTTPISPHLFALALKDLPLDTLHTKAAEIQNSISHLLASNTQLQPLAEAGDEECKEALKENEEVVGRMRQRIDLCKAEAEGRGLRWHLGGEEGGEVKRVEGQVNGSGSLGDEELRRRLEETLGDDGEEDEEGVYL
ncbi:uncharacterized protein RCC_02729 [Ramularia collo-cygni]|uniref:Uncharacterized protein n=1 Tax=Ramularia collo-cygni TaxID=112498 RepID=A0A2D3V327_9PEZI|nr:uncharacterized protein RCC_02729 [Ramularia collo-cygni]CZT16894.1 uncharacterized protein RCC_02729 [Ramularia collo-cygni]